MGFDRVTLPSDRKGPERPPWTNWLILTTIVLVIAIGLIVFL